MSSTAHLILTPEEHPADRVVRLSVWTVAVLAVGPVALFGSAFLHRYSKNRSGRWRIGLWVVAALNLLVLLWYGEGITTSYSQTLTTFFAGSNNNIWSQIAFIWTGSLAFIPLGAVMWSMIDKVMTWLRPRTLTEQLEDERTWRVQREAALGRDARSSLSRRPALQGHGLRLGTMIKGDLFKPQFGIGREGRWLVLDESLLDQHLFILGSTGAGKTETIKRLVGEILQTTGRDLYLIDGKGDNDFAKDVRGLAYAAGRGHVPVFRLGTGEPGAAYDGFRGEAQDIYNRLAAMIGVSEATGEAQYYADINRDLLQLICYAPEGPPRSFAEVRQRLDLQWLRRAWQDDEIESKTLDHFSKQDLEGLTRRLRPLAREFHHIVHPQGFALEEVECAVFSLRTQSVSDTASRFLHLLIEDFKDFAGKRQKRPGVLIIDEFGAFSNENIVALLTLARSAKLGVILATQDVASLGGEKSKRLILANTRTKFLMSSDFPQEVAELAGTIQQIESSLQHEAGEATGMGSARLQHAFKIDMNEAATLQPGEGFLIRQRHAAKVRVSRVEEVPPAPPEQLHRFAPVKPATDPTVTDEENVNDDAPAPPIIEF